jgi:hypothetical protein
MALPANASLDRGNDLAALDAASLDGALDSLILETAASATLTMG